MKCNVKTFPCRNCTDACYCEDPKEWIENFEEELRERLKVPFKDCITVKELLGE